MTDQEMTRLRIYYLRDLNELTLPELKDYSDLLLKSRVEANRVLAKVET